MSPIDRRKARSWSWDNLEGIGASYEPHHRSQKAEIITLCRKHGVVRLDLFGSATGPSWSPETSDFDFVVEFADYGPGIFVRFIDFGDEMERLLGRRVDLISEKRMKPRFRRSVEETRQVVLT